MLLNLHFGCTLSGDYLCKTAPTTQQSGRGRDWSINCMGTLHTSRHPLLARITWISFWRIIGPTKRWGSSTWLSLTYMMQPFPCSTTYLQFVTHASIAKNRFASNTQTTTLAPALEKWILFRYRVHAWPNYSGVSVYMYGYAHCII